MNRVVNTAAILIHKTSRKLTHKRQRGVAAYASFTKMKDVELSSAASTSSIKVIPFKTSNILEANQDKVRWTGS